MLDNKAIENTSHNIVRTRARFGDKDIMLTRMLISSLSSNQYTIEGFKFSQPFPFDARAKICLEESSKRHLSSNHKARTAQTLSERCLMHEVRE